MIRNTRAAILAVLLASITGPWAVGCDRCSSQPSPRDAQIDELDPPKDADPDATVIPQPKPIRFYVNTVVDPSETGADEPPRQRAMNALIRAFNTEAEYKHIEVIVEFFNEKDFQKTVDGFFPLEEPADVPSEEPAEVIPDVFTGVSGYRMRSAPKYLLELNDLWSKLEEWQVPESTDRRSPWRAVVTVNDSQYGVPYTVYHWVFVYRRDLFKRPGPPVPGTLGDFEGVCEYLRKQKRITPVALGTYLYWPTMGWFDYLDLRMNGLESHEGLMSGRNPYTDKKVKDVFAKWKQWIDLKCFTRRHEKYVWEELAPSLRHEESAMILFSNAMLRMIPEEEHDQYGLFRFPTVESPDAGVESDAGVGSGAGTYEIAPVEMLHIPKEAKNQYWAQEFLAFAARSEIQTQINEILGQVPPNPSATIPFEDPFLKTSAEILRSAKGWIQSYDRATHPEMGRLGKTAFREFMLHPKRRDVILKRLEKDRERIFGPVQTAAGADAGPDTTP